MDGVKDSPVTCDETPRRAQALLGRRAEALGIPLHALIQVTARCNYRCAHCYEVHTKGEGELTTAEIDRILGELAEIGVCYIGYTGGEFFTRRDADALLRLARKHNFVVRLLTTGYHIDERRADLIRDLGIFEVQLSLYGHEAKIHETVTLLPGSWKRTVMAARRLRARGVFVMFKSPIMSVNAPYLSDLYRLAEDLGCAIRTDPKLTVAEDGSMRPLMLRASDQMLAKFYSEKFVPLGLSYDRNRLTDRSCNVGVDSFMINPMGLVFPCTQISVACGDLRKQSVREVWSSSRLLKTLRGITWADLEPCNSCDVRRYCSHCHGHAMMEDGALFGKSSEDCRHALILREQLRSAGLVPDGERALPPPTDKTKLRRVELELAYVPPPPNGGIRPRTLRVLA